MRFVIFRHKKICELFSVSNNFVQQYVRPRSVNFVYHVFVYNYVVGLSPSTVGSPDWFQKWFRKEAHRFSQSLFQPYSETPQGCPRVLLGLPIGFRNGLELRHVGLPNRSSNRIRRRLSYEPNIRSPEMFFAMVSSQTPCRRQCHGILSPCFLTKLGKTKSTVKVGSWSAAKPPLQEAR